MQFAEEDPDRAIAVIVLLNSSIPNLYTYLFEVVKLYRIYILYFLFYFVLIWRFYMIFRSWCSSQWWKHYTYPRNYYSKNSYKRIMFREVKWRKKYRNNNDRVLKERIQWWKVYGIFEYTYSTKNIKRQISVFRNSNLNSVV